MLSDEELQRVLDECDDQARGGGYEPWEDSDGEGACATCGVGPMSWQEYIHEGDQGPEWIEAAICERCGSVAWEAVDAPT